MLCPCKRCKQDDSRTDWNKVTQELHLEEEAGQSTEHVAGRRLLDAERRSRVRGSLGSELAAGSIPAAVEQTKLLESTADASDGIDVDDGGVDSATCNADCSTDSYVNSAAGEDCDDAGADTSSCDGDCTTATCGDNYTNPAAGEACLPLRKCAATPPRPSSSRRAVCSRDIAS